MTKRITSVFLCFLLVFTIVITDYKKVSAFEWAIPTITFDVALPFLMGLLGVTYATSDSTFAPTEDEFFSYANEQNISGPDVRAWLDNVFSGTLNQASNVWTCFKSWVKSLVNKSNEGTTSGTIDTTSLLSVIQNFIPSVQSVTNNSFDFSKCMISKISYYTSSSHTTLSNVTYQFSFYDSSYSSYSFSGTSAVNFTINGNSESVIAFGQNTVYPESVIVTDMSTTLLNRSNPSYSMTQSNGRYAYEYYFVGFQNVPSLDWIHSLNGESIFELLSLDNVDIDNLDLLGNDAISTSIPDTIPLPWQNVGDTTQDISQTIEGLIEAVNEGTLELSDLITTIQGLLGVITVDTTQDIVIPETVNPDTEEPVTPEEVVTENINNSAFILSGLEKVFPFCLPFDLYNFVTLLVADPVAPVINFPIYDPTTKESIDIVIDFSQWETVVILFRYIFDFLFIIGMILLSRSLIGGGDKS